MGDVSLTGVEKVAKKVQDYGAKAGRHVAASLYYEAELMMTEAKRLTPVDTGALRASGIVEQPVIGLGGFGSDVSVRLGFGGPAAPYAVYVHENLDPNVQHKVGQAKFLETAVLNGVVGLAERIADSMREAG